MIYRRKTILGNNQGKKQFARPLRHGNKDFLREYLGIGKDDCIPIHLRSDRWKMDPEPYVAGLEHARETKLMPEELLV